MRKTLGFVGDGQARRPHRQRLLRRLHPGRSRRCSTAAAPPRTGSAPGISSSAYPQVKLEPDRIFVRDGNIWSSAGISAGIDLALAMVAEDYGDEIAQQTARQLVLYHRRSGGQSQFSSLLELKAPNGALGPLLAWARRTSRRAADGGGHGRAGRHELTAFRPRLHRRDRGHAIEGMGGASPS